MGLFSRTRAPARISSPNRSSGAAHAGASLVAAGERINRKRADETRRLIQPWQQSALNYYDIVPEIKYAARFYSRIQAIRLYAAELTDEGEWEEITDRNDPAVQTLERIQDPGGGRAGLLSQYGILKFVIGEAYLTVTKGDDDFEQWEMLGPDELRATASGFTRTRAPSLPAESYAIPENDADTPSDREMIVYRLWRKHPRWSQLADATMHGVLDICEELVLLTKAVRSRARSRLAGSGILIVNGNVVPILQDGEAPDEDPDEDPFIRALTGAMIEPIKDEGTASAVVPLVVRVDVDKELGLDNVMKHLQIVDPTQLYPETGLRNEARERLGIGLDMPPEILKGLADANHWSGWQIDEQAYKAHLAPLCGELCDELTAVVLRPTLKENGVNDWSRRAIKFDPADLVNQPDRSGDAKDLHKAGALSNQALRDAGGFSEDDAPSEEEHREWLGIQLRDANIAINGEPSAAVAPPAGDDPEGEDDPLDDGDKPTEVEKAPPEKPAAADDAPGESLSAQVMGAAQLALLRAREIAGSRLRNYARRDKEGEKLVDGVPNGLVAATLGLEQATALRAPDARDLVAGAGELILETLRLWKIDERLATRLAQAIEQHAARTLYEQNPAPLPAAFVNYAREAAGGS